MKTLIKDIKKCTICLPHLEAGVNPVVSGSPKSKVAIIGQAPGSVVHKTGIPWDDKSGDRLRKWLGVSKEAFYNTDLFALVPMGFCYPGKGKRGDLPPRPECAPKWHEPLLAHTKQLELVLLVGTYAQRYYLQDTVKKTLTLTVQNFNRYLPKYLPLPHPSPRNNIWLKKNPWFEKDVLPELKHRITAVRKAGGR